MTTTVRTGRPATLTLEPGDARQVFTRPAQDGINQGRPATYRVAQIGIYDDGSIWVWAEQLTKAGRPYKSGMGLTLGNEDRLAEIYGQDVADVVAEAVAAHRAAEDEALTQLAERGGWTMAQAREAVDDSRTTAPALLEQMYPTAEPERLTMTTDGIPTDAANITKTVLRSATKHGLTVRYLAFQKGDVSIMFGTYGTDLNIYGQPSEAVARRILTDLDTDDPYGCEPDSYNHQGHDVRTLKDKIDGSVKVVLWLANEEA